MMALLAMLLVGAAAATSCSSTVEGKGNISSTAPVQSAASNAESTASLSGKLILNGSTSVAKVCQAPGEGFTEKYPQATMEKGGTGSSDAVKAVNNNTTLIGNLSRSLKDEGKPADFEIVEMAIDDITTVISPEGRVGALTSERITKIYTNKISNWKNVGGADQKITVIGRKATSGIRDGFKSILNIKEKTKLSAELSSTGEVISKVGGNPAVVGYVSLDSVNQSVRAITVDNVEPLEEAIKDGTYRLQRSFIEIYKKGNDNELVKVWFEFIDSSEEQQIIRDAGLVVK